MPRARATVEQKRLSQSNRDRRYRAKKKQEFQELDAVLRQLQEQHDNLKLVTLVDDIATAEIEANQLYKALAENQKLRSDAIRMHAICQALNDWVLSQVPSRELTPKASWMHSTLVANPIARVYGYKWFSDKIYHAAQRYFPQEPFGNTVDDAMRHVLHTDVDEDGLSNVGAMELHLQTTFFTNFKTAADLFWSFVITNNFITSSFTSSSWIEDSVDARLVYHCVLNPHTGTYNRRILRMYEEPNRVIITFASIADDERATFERVSDKITISRFTTLHTAPVTARGPASLEQIGRLYGRSAHGIEHREAYIEQLRSIAERVYLNGFMHLQKSFTAVVEQAMQASCEDDDAALDLDIANLA
ncbi:unnamed protein product [Aphanomyces euteiches]